MDDRWLGPYSINRCIGKGVHEFKNMKGAVLKTKVNVNRLKVYKCQHRSMQNLTCIWIFLTIFLYELNDHMHAMNLDQIS